MRANYLLPLLGCLVVIKGEDPNCYIRPCYSMNLACNNKGKIQNCQVDAKLLKEAEFRRTIEDKFNTLRNDVAGGKIYRNLPTAARMGRMSWNKELAHFATLDAQRCTVLPRPRICSNNFNLIGNMAELYGFHTDNTTSRTTETIHSILNGWMSNVRSISRYQTIHSPFNEDEDLKMLESTLLLIEGNTQFGCAVLHYTSTLYTYILLSCVFGTDNVDGQRLYSWSKKPGIKCRYRDRTYKNLCTKDEKYEQVKVNHEIESLRMARNW